MYFTECNKTENFLRRHGVKYTYLEAVPVTDLKPGWNEFNRGRPPSDARVMAAVENYACMMIEGSAAPGVVLFKTKEGYEVLDGCQRLMASIEVCEATTCAAYIVHCQHKTAGLIRRTINVFLQGSAPVDTMFATRACVEDYMIHGTMSAKELSGWLGITVERVKQVYKSILARTRYEHAVAVAGKDYVPKHRPPDWMLHAVHTKTQASDWEDAAIPLVKFIDDLCSGRYTNGDSGDIVDYFANIRRRKDVNVKTQYETRRSELFRDFPDFRGRVNGRRKATPIEKIAIALKGMVTLCRDASKKDCHLTEVTAHDLNEQWHEVGRLLREMCTNKARREGNFDI